jgi:hypothetical protein
MSPDGKAREVSAVDREIVSTLIETGAVNFEAIGQTIAKVGPSSVLVEDGWERWCGSDLRIYRWPRRFGLEELIAIRDIAREVQLGAIDRG